MTIPKPWQNTLHAGVAKVSVDGVEGEVDAVVWYCSCGDYTTAWKIGVEAMKLARHAGEHMDSHPKPPLSVVQLGNKDFVMVFEVPGTDEEHPAHMTIAASEEVFMDNRKLAAHIGPISSPMHFEYQKSWQNHVAGGDSMPMMPVSVMKIDRDGTISPLQTSDGLQQVLNLLRARQGQESEGGDSSGIQREAEHQWTGFLNSPPILRFEQTPVDYTQPDVAPVDAEGHQPGTRWTPEMVEDILKAYGATDMGGVHAEHFDFGDPMLLHGDYLRPADFSDAEDKEE
jgi:hypothetical protein